MKANTTIRENARKHNVFLYEIADRLGLYETSFIRKLRKELSAEETAKILGIIEQLAAEKA